MHRCDIAVDQPLDVWPARIFTRRKPSRSMIGTRNRGRALCDLDHVGMSLATD
jgi:hypothetical protein